MQYGLTNAPATFQHLMNQIFRDVLDTKVLCYLDDLLLFTQAREEQEELLAEVLRRLRTHCLFVKAEKSDFFVDRTDHVGFVVDPDGIHVDEKKIASVMEWPEPKSGKDFQAFLGFANFYRRFIRGFSKIAVPLTRLTKTDTQFNFSDQARSAFHNLKNAFQDNPVLAHSEAEKPCVIGTDASDFAISAILSQDDRPIAFHSGKLTAPGLNYEIHDKELLAIIDASSSWRHYIEGSQHPVTVFTDHKNLEYSKTSKMLTRRQARWSLLLNAHNYVLKFRPGKQSTKPDALSRRPDYREGSKDSEAIPETLPRPLQLSALEETTVYSPTSDIVARIKSTLQKDPTVKHQLSLL